MRSQWLRLMVASAALLMLVVVGCNKSPMDPVSTVSSEATFDDFANPPTAFAAVAEAPQIKARVATVDQNRRMLTFETSPDTVIALRNCQVVRSNNNAESPIPFVNIKQGDSCEVRCEQHQDGYLYAWHIKVCGEDGNYDLAFRDTVMTIDYALNQFTVVGRSETILVDSATVIFGVIPKWNTEPKNENPGPAAGKVSPDDNGNAGLNRISYAFTDLMEGDVLEIRAKIVDGNTLLAVYIKVANCESKTTCEQFTATLASVDSATRLVIFTDRAETGWVCPGAKLLDINGEELLLADFEAGDAVSVKGVPLEGDLLKISFLQKL